MLGCAEPGSGIILMFTFLLSGTCCACSCDCPPNEAIPEVKPRPHQDRSLHNKGNKFSGTSSVSQCKQTSNSSSAMHPTRSSVRLLSIQEAQADLEAYQIEGQKGDLPAG